MKLTGAKKKAISVLMGIDYLTAILAWCIYWVYRHQYLQEAFPQVFPGHNTWDLRDYIISLLIVPSAWVGLYYLSGTYFDLYRKSRLIEVYRSIISVIIGAFILGLIAFANDTNQLTYFIRITSGYFLTHLVVVILSRLIWLSKIKRDLKAKKVVYNTLIVGGNGKVDKVYKELKNHPKALGHHLVGIVNVSPQALPYNYSDAPLLGNLDNLETIIEKYQIEEVIIGVESSEHLILENLLTRLSYSSVIIKVMPDMYDIISGSVRINNIYDPVFISINPELLPDWQRVCKRVLDVTASALALLILSPLLIFTALKVRWSSKGPIIFRQQRIGLLGKPFYILKFRSMYENAEANGPQLSSDFDPRITPWGKVMRKWRLDELPQFYNVLKGEMSLVGPRPERKHFIDIISAKQPHYKYLHRVKPGLTSWGMVQYGYAENVEEMVERMKYDLLYIENCSLLLDVKIMFHTLLVLFQGRGK